MKIAQKIVGIFIFLFSPEACHYPVQQTVRGRQKSVQIPRSTVISEHYENTPIEIYWKFYHQKNEKFQTKNSDILLISAETIDCGYSLEPPRRGGSNKYHNLCFWVEIRKIIYTPLNPSFTI